MMPTDRQARLLSANRELRNFLERVDALIHGTSDIGADELRALGRLLEAAAPEIGEPSSTVSLDAGLQAQTQEYIGNLRALQAALEQVRCVMFSRLKQIDAARQHIDGLQGWVSAYRQTA